MISLDKEIENLVSVLFDIFVNKNSNDLDSDMQNIKSYIEEEKLRIKNFVLDIYQKTYYQDYDRYGTINSILDIIITRHAINRFVVKLFQKRHLFYNSSLLSSVYRKVTRCMGFEQDRNMPSNPILMYYLENIEYWNTIKTTEEHIYSYLKIIYPLSDIKIAKVTVHRHTYSPEEHNPFLVLSFGSKSTYINYDVIKNDINHFVEYSDLMENITPIDVNNNLITEKYVGYTIPVIALVTESNMMEIESNVRKYLTLLLKDYNSIYFKTVLNIDDIKINLIDAACLFVLISNILFADVKLNFVQPKWISLVFGRQPSYVLINFLNKYFSDYISSVFKVSSNIFYDISTYIVTKYLDEEIDISTPEDEIVKIVLDYVRENITEVPSIFSEIVISMKKNTVFSKGITYLASQVFSKSILDLVDENLISLVYKTVSGKLIDIVYSIKQLYDTNIISKEDLYKFLLEITMQIDLNLIDSKFSQYLTSIYTKYYDTSEVDYILSTIKPLLLHFSSFSLIVNGNVEDYFNMNETIGIVCKDQFKERAALDSVDYCNFVGSNNIDFLNYISSNKDRLVFNPKDILDLKSTKLKLDHPNSIVCDTIYNNIVYYKDQNKNFISTSSRFIRDLLVIKDNNNNNIIEVVSW